MGDKKSADVYQFDIDVNVITDFLVWKQNIVNSYPVPKYNR